MPIEAITGAPAFVAGFSIVRGLPIPVVTIDALLGGGKDDYRRLVVLRSGPRRLGLLVTDVIGVRTLGAEVFSGLPPLLEAGAGAVDAIGAIDGELATLLDAARLVPDDVFAMLEALELAP